MATVFHLAAVYRFWAADPRALLRRECRRDVEHPAHKTPAGHAGVSSIRARSGRSVWPSTADLRRRDTLVHFEHLFGHYKRSKYLAEHEVLHAGATGPPRRARTPDVSRQQAGHRADAHGPDDHRIPERSDPGIRRHHALNVAHVDDVARGHVLAPARGALGRSYILGGDNMSLQDMLTTLADVCGLRCLVSACTAQRPADRAHREWFQAACSARADIDIGTGAVGHDRMEYDTSRARTELGYTSMPARDGVRRAARWFVDNGFVKDGRPTIRGRRRLGPTEIDLRATGRGRGPHASARRRQITDDARPQA